MMLQDQYLEGCSDGSFNGIQYFTCPHGRGLFCLKNALQLENESHKTLTSKLHQ